MKLIFAQGNPGSKYASTRHNSGFIAVSAFADKYGASFIAQPKFKAEVATISHNGDKVLLVKPTTYYNETGMSARAVSDFYKLDISRDLLAVHDDIALPFGTLRVREKGSDAGNNGIKSLNQHLGQDYWRLRIGIYNGLRDQLHDADFVLGNFSHEEAVHLNATIIPSIFDVFEMFLDETIQPLSLNTLID